jgi:hypothetical protein
MAHQPNRPEGLALNALNQIIGILVPRQKNGRRLIRRQRAMRMAHDRSIHPLL